VGYPPSPLVLCSDDTVDLRHHHDQLTFQ
jgi:hypothetical protein